MMPLPASVAADISRLALLAWIDEQNITAEHHATIIRELHVTAKRLEVELSRLCECSTAGS